VEEIAYVPVGELNAIDEFDEDVVNELRNRARDVLLTQAIASEEVIDAAEPAQDLLDLEGMDKATAMQLAAKGACTREDLAELAVDDLMELDEMDEERAGKLIMSARAHWFEDSESAESGS
jgi:N utilization substance protein A